MIDWRSSGVYSFRFRTIILLICKGQSLFADGKYNRIDGDDSFVSPQCHEMHKEAAKNTDRSPKKVKKRLKYKAGNVNVEDVLHIPLVIPGCMGFDSLHLHLRSIMVIE